MRHQAQVRAWLRSGPRGRHADGTTLGVPVHLVRVFTVSSLLLTVACAKDAADSGDSESAVPTGPADFDEILTTVLVPSCGFDSCHGSGVGYLRIHDQQTEEEWLEMESRVFAGRKLITPGDAANSYLIKKMEGASDIEGDVMPPSGSIDQARTNRVRRWIDDL